MAGYRSEFDTHQYPLFVTYYLQGRLRGCIGTFKQDHLGKTLQSYSIIAALKDSRFSPISNKELPHLTCEVSLLSNFEEINDPLDWEVGKHGIEIEFRDQNGKGPYRGTYLPHVASEQGWNQRDTLDSLLQKAGFYDGKLEDVKDKFVLIRRYQSLKKGVTYTEYQETFKQSYSV